MLHQALTPDLPQADQEWFLTEQGEGAVVQVFFSWVSFPPQADLPLAEEKGFGCG